MMAGLMNLGELPEQLRRPELQVPQEGCQVQYQRKILWKARMKLKVEGRNTEQLILLER